MTVALFFIMHGWRKYVKTKTICVSVCACVCVCTEENHVQYKSSLVYIWKTIYVVVRLWIVEEDWLGLKFGSYIKLWLLAMST